MRRHSLRDVLRFFSVLRSGTVDAENRINIGAGRPQFFLVILEVLLSKYRCGAVYSEDTKGAFFSDVVCEIIQKNLIEIFKANARCAITQDLNWEEEKNTLIKEYKNVKSNQS